MTRIQHSPARHLLPALLVSLCGLVACGSGSSTGESGGASSITPETGTAPEVCTGEVVSAPLSSTSENKLQINTNRTSGVAPLAVHFNTLNTTAMATGRPFHELKYTWNFQDAAGGATWAYGAKAGNTGADSKSSKNTAYGPVAAHVFESPGTYTVVLTAFDGTNTFTKTQTITVGDPNTVLRDNTVCVYKTAAPTPGTNGCPAGATVAQLAQWSDLATLANTKKRILLERGQTWGVSSDAFISSPGPGVIGAYGSGAKPKIDLIGNNRGFIFSATNDWRLMDMEITSSTSTGTEALETLNQKTAVMAVNGGGNHLFLRLDIHNIFFGISGGRANGVAIVDTEIKDTFTTGNGIGIWMDAVDTIAIMGLYNHNVPANHGARIQGTANTIVSNSTFANSHGNALTIRGKTLDSTGTVYQHWDGTWTENVVVSDNLIDGAGGHIYAVSMTPQSIWHAERLRNVIFERNHVSNMKLEAKFHVADSLTVRNNIFHTNYNYAIGIPDETKYPACNPPPNNQFIYNNTMHKSAITVANPALDGFSAISLYGSGMRHMVIKNNLAYAPLAAMNGSTSSQGGGSFMVANDLLPGVHYLASNNSERPQIKQTNPFTVSVPVSSLEYRPATAPYGITTADAALPNWEDFANKSLSRTSNRSLGAFMP